MYSPIKKLYIKNFRNLGEVEIDFTESPIVCLVGENEAGKTSVIKAFSVCALHSTPRDQKDFIRDGTQMFGIKIELEDGSSVTRLKTNAVNKYVVEKADGSKWETNKISEGLPVEVQEIMGLIEEPETKEYLHIRTYEDKLLFVVTPASANYKVMYNALKVEQLTKAIKNGSAEANQLKSRLVDTNTGIRTLEGQLSTFNIVDMEPLISVKERLTAQMSAIDKLEKALKLKKNIEECYAKKGILRLIDTFKLSEIDIAKAANINNAGKVLNNITSVTNLRNSIQDVVNLENIDTSILERLSYMKDKIVELDTKKADAGALVHVSEISEIDESSIIQLSRAKSLISSIQTSKNMANIIDTKDCPEVSENVFSVLERLNKVKDSRDRINQHKTSVQQINTYCDQVLAYLKQCGVAFETCTNCGSDVLIDIDKIRLD